MLDLDSSLETPFDLLRDQDAESIVGQDLVSKAQQANYAGVILCGCFHRNRASTRPAALRAGHAPEPEGACCREARGWRIPGRDRMRGTPFPPCSEDPPEPGRR